VVLYIIIEDYNVIIVIRRFGVIKMNISKSKTRYARIDEGLYKKLLTIQEHQKKKGNEISIADASRMLDLRINQVGGLREETVLT
jgi:hypothetical protein